LYKISFCFFNPFSGDAIFIEKKKKKKGKIFEKTLNDFHVWEEKYQCF